MAVRTARIRGATEMRGPTGVVLALLYARAVLASPWLGCELLLGDRLLDARAVARVPWLGGARHRWPALLGSASCCSTRGLLLASRRSGHPAGVTRVRELLLSATGCCSTCGLLLASPWLGERGIGGPGLLGSASCCSRRPAVARRAGCCSRPRDSGNARHRRAGVARVRELLLGDRLLLDARAVACVPIARGAA